MSANSPFKFLDAYNKEDKEIFFGRKDEVEQLYELVFQSNLTLVYGQSGTGKTSLVQCGLANRFAVTDWLNAYIRRNEDINQSLLRSLARYEAKEDARRGSALLQRLMKKREGIKRIEVEEEEPESEFIRRLRSIYKQYLKPVYLIFDQFEELFILGNREEQKLFYESVDQILQSEPYCRIILIMREESIAQLFDFERVVPQLFDKRLRVEPMGRANTVDVITRSSEHFGIALESADVPEQIIDILSEGRGRVELTYLQVFLDQMYKKAEADNQPEVVFTSEIIQQLGSIEDILGDFLEKQTKEIQSAAEREFKEISPVAVQKVLSTFVTLEGTKRPMSAREVRAGKLAPEQVQFIIQQLEKNRILRFEDDLYEISHDALALKVADARSAEEVALLQIAKIVRDRYLVFNTTHTLLNSNELQLTEAHRNALQEEQALGKEEWAFVEKSIKTYRRRRRARLFLIALVISVLATAAVYSSYSAAQVNNKNIELAQKSYDLILEQGKAFMATYEYEKAVNAFQSALEINPEGQEAVERLRQAEESVIKSSQFDQLFAEGENGLAEAEANRGDDLSYARNLLAAREKFEAALALGVKESNARGKLEELDGKLSAASTELIKNADVYFRAGGFSDALKRYELALPINPDYPGLQQKVQRTRNRIQ